MAVYGALKVNARLACGDDYAIGPGKASVLDAVAAHGSISAAGRALGMSYRRVWMLVDSMNRCWDTVLVETSAGGRGGSRLSERGREVLGRYRAMEARMLAAATAGDYALLVGHIREIPLASEKAGPD